jgi:hypothetical protein
MEIWELMAAGEYGTLKVLMVRVLEVWADVDRSALCLLVDQTRLRKCDGERGLDGVGAVLILRE